VGFDAVKRQNRSSAELAVLKIAADCVVVQSSAILCRAREEAALQEPENWKNITEF